MIKNAYCKRQTLFEVIFFLAMQSSVHFQSGRFCKFPLWILLALGVCVFAGCSLPLKTPMSTAKQSALDKGEAHPNANAAYNKSYTVNGKRYHPMRSAIGYSETGVASWYGSESGNKTAMGGRFNPKGMTAAHKTLPLPTKVKVTNLSNGKSVNVIVNDRGPFKKNRIIDLSQGAAKIIGLDKQGLTKVKVEYLETLARNP